MAKWQVLTLSVSAAHMSCTGWAVKEKQLGRERGCGYCLGDLEIKQGLFSFLFFPLFFLVFPSKPFLFHKTCYLCGSCVLLSLLAGTVTSETYLFVSSLWFVGLEAFFPVFATYPVWGFIITAPGAEFFRVLPRPLAYPLLK